MYSSTYSFQKHHPSCAFDLDLSKASEPATAGFPTAVILCCLVLALRVSHMFLTRKPGQVPGWVLIGGCSIVQQTLGVLFHMWSVATINGRQGLAGELLAASAQSLRSPGLCLPLGGRLQQIFTQPLAHKPQLLRDRLWWVSLRNYSIIFGFAKVKSQVSHTVNARPSTAQYIQVHAEYVCA